jgi:hypothetical protein
MLVTLAGMVMLLVRLEHPPNSQPPMLVTVDGIVKLVRLEQDSKE